MSSIKPVGGNLSMSLSSIDASHPGLKGKSIVEVVSPELLIGILDHLSPLQQTAAARTCQAMMQASNSSCLTLVKPEERTTAGGRSDWGREFKSLPDKCQRKLRAEVGLLPDLYSNDPMAVIGVEWPKFEMCNTYNTVIRFEIFSSGTSIDTPMKTCTLRSGESATWYLPDGWRADKLMLEKHHDDGVIRIVANQLDESATYHDLDESATYHDLSVTNVSSFAVRSSQQPSSYLESPLRW